MHSLEIKHLLWLAPIYLYLSISWIKAICYMFITCPTPQYFRLFLRPSTHQSQHTAGPHALLRGGWWETRAQQGFGFRWRLWNLRRLLCVSLCLGCHFLAHFPSSQCRRHNTVVITGHQPLLFYIPLTWTGPYICVLCFTPPSYSYTAFSSLTLVVSSDYLQLCPTSALLKYAEILQIQWNALVCFCAYRKNMNTCLKKSCLNIHRLFKLQLFMQQNENNSFVVLTVLCNVSYILKVW